VRDAAAAAAPALPRSPFERRNIMRTQLLAAAVLSCFGLAACNQQSPSGLPSSSPGPTSQAPAGGSSTIGQKVDDAAITAKVKATLLASNDVSGTDISVETNAGRVTLTGKVKDQAQVDRAVAMARAIDGVVDVENLLLVGQG
jgi:hypothetical protein